MELESGHEVELCSGEEDIILKEHFDCLKAGTVRLQPQGWILTKSFLELANKFYNFPFRETDIVIMTFPKSGTSWTQEMVWTMVHNPNLDNPKAKEPLNFRSPFLDYDMLLNSPHMKDVYPNKEENPRYQHFKKVCPNGEEDNGLFLQISEAASNPRILKTHLPFPLFKRTLLDNCKVIYVTRNPKDVCISFCHHMKFLKTFNFLGNFEDYVHHFTSDRILYGPYWNHVLAAWEKRSHPNLHFITYEKLTKNISEETNNLSKFLGLNLTNEQKKNVIEKSSFSSMKSHPSSSTGTNKGLNMSVIEKDGGFFRKGISGDWMTALTSAQIQLFDQWTEKRTKNVKFEFE